MGEWEIKLALSDFFMPGIHSQVGTESSVQKVFSFPPLFLKDLLLFPAH